MIRPVMREPVVGEPALSVDHDETPPLTGPFWRLRCSAASACWPHTVITTTGCIPTPTASRVSTWSSSVPSPLPRRRCNPSSCCLRARSKAPSRPCHRARLYESRTTRPLLKPGVEHGAGRPARWAVRSLVTVVHLTQTFRKQSVRRIATRQSRTRCDTACTRWRSR